MPADNIKRAIRRGTGEEPGVSYEEAQYEAYGPGGAAVIIDVLTDNKNRTVGELRHLLEKHGGNLAATNAVAWMFTKKGYIVVEKAKADEEKLMAAVLDAGADDLQDDDDNWEVLQRARGVPGRARSGEAARHRAGQRRGLDDSAELRQARRQARAADGEADGSARRPRRRAARLVELRHRGEGDRGLARVKIFGIDPGSERTGYGCVETDGSRHRIVICGAISVPAAASFPDKLLDDSHRPGGAARASAGPTASRSRTCFYATNVRSALKLGHARGVAMLAAVEAGLPVVEYTPAEIKRAVVGYGRAEKHAGAADGQAAARPRRRAVAARRRRRAGGRHLPRALACRRPRGRRVGRAARARPRRAGGTTGPHDRDRAPARPHPREAAQPHRRRRERRRLRRRPCRCRRSTASASRAARSRCASTRTCARTRSRCTGSRRALEQELFERLIGVSGIGPKLALAVLSGIEPPELIRAIERGDLARLTAIPGVGKKTSERIVLELKDRLPRAHVAAAAAGRRAPEPSALRDDRALGADEPGVSSAARRKSRGRGAQDAIGPTASFERTLKQALRELAK